ncbi:small acid-soluble spore protein SspI [Paenibacillus sp. MY03]|jgi:small acid-soluble spore protein I (minor)|uniref:Small, acid-soluble spore protein I n=1 Tax=Paenibacillus agaridevorans TaxID=171404 RepID=A0A2R5ENV0_9BACL|nr:MULTISPECIES: small acid-soluble spore protein SspI [Paenibacillus]OUS74031.1 small acid-soluble spore protein SspI [Paenibacillus sp. MY03]GBG06678.1 putative spore protein [Paenibacillus agaridevorans]
MNPIIDLRQAIVNRVQDNSKEQLAEVIEGSVDHDEKALPGLGVLFEMVWKQSSENEQSHLVNAIYQHLHGDTGNAAANPSPS